LCTTDNRLKQGRLPEGAALAGEGAGVPTAMQQQFTEKGKGLMVSKLSNEMLGCKQE
jgi:hypothetical protein